MEKQKYQDLINIFIEKNTQLNLSSIRSEDEIFEKHIKDSIFLSEFITFNPGETVLDLGSGGGFPGLPLAIMFPQTQFFLMDSTRKKVTAISEMAKALNLQNVETMWSRSEEYNLQTFDYITARSVAYLPQLLEVSYKLLKPTGHLLAYKLPSIEELSDGQKVAAKLHLVLKSMYEYELNGQYRVIYDFKREDVH